MSKERLAYTLKPCGHGKCSACRLKDYEATEIDYVCDYLDRVAKAGKLKGVFVDVGAHVGLWSLSLSEWYQNRYNIVPTIYALEPDSQNFVRLRANAQQAETGIVPVQVAAWNRTEYLYLKRNENPSRHKVASVGRAGRQAMRVQGVALDSVANTPEKVQIDGIKIDVEGAELHVLNGARSILTENKQMIAVVEYSVEHFAEYGTTCKQVTGFMQAHGFRPARDIDVKLTTKLLTGKIVRVIFVKGDIS
jgi:FkbM family methyltransferase